MSLNTRCKPGDLLRTKIRFLTDYAFPLKSKSKFFYFGFRIEVLTKCNRGDFLLWLQEDQTMPECCFCLHQPTGRVLCVPIYHLEIVDLEEAKEESDPV